MQGIKCSLSAEPNPDHEFTASGKPVKIQTQDGTNSQSSRVLLTLCSTHIIACVIPLSHTPVK